MMYTSKKAIACLHLNGTQHNQYTVHNQCNALSELNMQLFWHCLQEKNAKLCATLHTDETRQSRPPNWWHTKWWKNIAATVAATKNLSKNFRFHWPWCRCPLCWIQLSTNWKILGIHCWMHLASLWCLFKQWPAYGRRADAQEVAFAATFANWFCHCMQVLHSQMLWWWCAWLPWLVGEFAQKEFGLCWLLTHPFPKLFMLGCKGEILICQFGILFLHFHAQPLPLFGLLKCCVFVLQSLGEFPLHNLHLYFHGLAILTTPKTSKGHHGKRKDFAGSWWFWLHPWAKSKDSLQWLANLATKPEMGYTYTIACVNGWQTCHLLHTQWWHTHTLNHEHTLP